jgi:hypothetical protein
VYRIEPIVFMMQTGAGKLVVASPEIGVFAEFVSLRLARF